MISKDISSRQPDSVDARRRPFFAPRVGLRLLVALVLAWIVLLAFFVTHVASR
jgi:hypothetical protein